MNSVLTEVTSQGFSEFISGTPVSVVDFTATWCGPCHALKPILEALATEYQGKVNIGKVDVDLNGDLANQFHVMSMPTIVFFQNGKPVDSMIGVSPKSVIKERIENLL